MAKDIRFKLEEKHTLWAGKTKKGDGILLDVKGHELVTNKFVSAFAWEVMASPLRVGAKYEARWGKPMTHKDKDTGVEEEKFTLWNFCPILDIVAEDMAKELPTESITTDTKPKKASELVGTAISEQQDLEYKETRLTYEEAKAKLSKSMSEFLDVLYVDYHLGQKK